ncbi:hypothetical protein ABC304_16180 [Microbacterium sp. 1P10UB]|uniref:hypothetical protein n=1 Tax=unclassified Microbacterium TaxID=2609290 RepID=UPI0039A059CE
MSGSKARASKKTSKKQKSSKKHEKDAEKALAAAGDAVATARKAVKKSRGKLRKRAAKLTRRAEQLAKKHAAAQRKAEEAEEALSTVIASPTGETSDTTSSAPDAVTENGAGAPAPDHEVDDLTPPLPTPEPAPATLIELRRQAKEKKIPKYYRLAKADLIAALDAAQT